VGLEFIDRPQVASILPREDDPPPTGIRRRALSSFCSCFQESLCRRAATHTETLFDADRTCPLFRTAPRTRG